MKRKTIHMLHICLALVLGAAALLPSPTARPCQAEPEKEVLRLHILANSDSQQDQAIKLQVRDALLPLFESSESYESARAFVLQHGAELLSLCQKTLSACQASYGAQLLLGETPFPDRSYQGILFPAGVYDALCVVLGEGAGHNWWCVLFPPLCVVTKDGTLPEDFSGFTFESDILAFFKKHFGGKR